MTTHIDDQPPAAEPPTDWPAFAHQQIAQAEARGWRKDPIHGWVLDPPQPSPADMPARRTGAGPGARRPVAYGLSTDQQLRLHGLREAIRWTDWSDLDPESSRDLYRLADEMTAYIRDGSRP